MPKKIKTLTVTNGWEKGGSELFVNTRDPKAQTYRVEKVTDSVDFHPGQMLGRTDVESLCASREWRVTVVPFKDGRS